MKAINPTVNLDRTYRGIEAPLSPDLPRPAPSPVTAEGSVKVTVQEPEGTKPKTRKRKAARGGN